MHGRKDFQAMENERTNRQHGDFPSTISETPTGLPATITQRMVGGLEELQELGSKLTEILNRIQGPCVANSDKSTVIHEPGLQGEVDRFRRLTGQLNGLAEEILIHL